MLTVEKSNLHKLEYSKTELQVSLDRIDTSVHFLAQNGLLHQAILNPTNENISALSDFWLLVARTQKFYSSLRFIGMDGMETIRINSSERVSEIVDKERLQNKADSQYFNYAQSLKTNQIGTFGVDFETDQLEIIVPHRPAYRIILPVELQGERKGYFVANVNLKRLYKDLAYKRETENLPSIFNQEGYFVLSNDNTPILGNLLEENSAHSIAKLYPSLWNKIQKSHSGTVKEGQVWLSFTTSELNLDGSKLSLIFLLKSDLSDLQPVKNEDYNELFIQAFFILIIIFLISFTFVAWNYNHEKNSVASKIARAAMNGMSAMVITDHNNRIIQVNEQFTKSSGYTLDEVKGKQPSMFSSGNHGHEFYTTMWDSLESDGIWEGEVINKRRDGSLITELLRIQTVRNKQGIVQFFVASFIDISHRKELEDRLRELSEKDPLSGLWNRRKFDAEMTAETQRVKRYPDCEKASLALLDIDHFKRINDKYGHDAGDKVITNVATTISSQLRETDMVARIGGEEFAIIMPHTGIQEAENVINRLRISINIQSEYDITASAGVTEICDKPSDSYKRADIALYESKTLGRNQVNVMLISESTSIA
ncbi:sensor domain-containing diguanylate cyclase [Vibrio japonicus]|uniref:sensor domain-containing diguanylate cyclase n=1 Tax=Vibrio japonicus TaxID=1824638 RepID=UPI0027B9B875|nr:diguanylate cyclase [Vibrio japonicus]